MKLEVLIPTPADCEVRSEIKFLNAQNIATIEILRQLYHVYAANVMSKQMVSRWCRQFTAGRQLHDEEHSGRPYIITDDLMELMISIFSYTSRNSCPVASAFSKCQRSGDDCHTEFQSQAADFYDTGIQTLVPRYEKCVNCGGEYV